MSEFVDYNKRSVSLPPGCKNLIDILQQTHWQATAAMSVQKSGAKSRQFAGKVSEMKKYLTVALKAPLRILGLTICPPGGSPCVEIRSTALLPTVQFVITLSVRQGTAEELAVRKFFNDNDLELPSAVEMAMPVVFPDLPHDIFFQIPTPPSNPAMLSQIITDLFKECCSLSDDSEILYTLFSYGFDKSA